jgi:DNA-3-methyladenine glycosylase II
MKLRAMGKPASVHFSMACATIGTGGLSTAVAMAALTPVRGIGSWSAQTFLIHDLARPAVVPAAGPRLLRAVAARWRLTALPTPGAVVVRAAAWWPYPSYCAAVLWRSLTAGAEEFDPKARGLLAQASHRAADQEPR